MVNLADKEVNVAIINMSIELKENMMTIFQFGYLNKNVEIIKNTIENSKIRKYNNN